MSTLRCMLFQVNEDRKRSIVSMVTRHVEKIGSWQFRHHGMLFPLIQATRIIDRTARRTL